MNRPTWQDLSDRQRLMIVGGGVLDAGLRAAGLIDVIRRPPGEVRGAKPLWIAALAMINSAGVLPTIYFVFGRRRTRALRA